MQIVTTMVSISFSNNLKVYFSKIESQGLSIMNYPPPTQLAFNISLKHIIHIFGKFIIFQLNNSQFGVEQFLPATKNPKDARLRVKKYVYYV